jgi:methylmalonyl-CoA mutase C-terminal domain/subunit
MQKKGKIRVLLGKPGLDTHERGVKLIAAYLRDHGMEVIYGGVFQTKESLAQTALQEDVDIIGLSYLSGAHQSLTREILDELRARGLQDVPVICGGIIPDEDLAEMAAIGVQGTYGPGTPMETIIEDIKRLVASENPRVD